MASYFHPKACVYCKEPLEALERKVIAAHGHPAYEAAQLAFERLPVVVQKLLLREAQGYVEAADGE